MNNALSFSSLLQDLQRQSVQAVLSILGIRNRPLRAVLERRFDNLPGVGGSFLSAPLFEATFGWEQDEETMQGLARSGLLHPNVINALNCAKGDPHFPQNRHPYVHQRRAWEVLLDGSEVRSAIISSGTGSGKTETFMIPVLDDLARQVAQGQRLCGIRAIFLYPLNALINNQRERLREWMKPFRGKLRFCLYNGLTPEHPPRERDLVEVTDRKTLRSDPPPVLVTNPTMLEFMLVRPQDAPILEASRGQLKWIILDEAHTYLGSQAAELALLLRRVMEGFGVDAENVHFVATSATIGGKDKEPLREFLASIAGIDPHKVSLIEGRRLVPKLSDLSLKDDSLQQLNEKQGEEFAIALVRNRTARFIRDSFAKADGHVLKVEQLMRMMRKEGLLSAADDQSSLEETLQWLETCSRADGDTGHGPFLPLRMHIFHRVMSGLWACCNPECSARDTELHNTDLWPYGQVYLDHRLRCSCGAPVYELASCGECRELYLLAEETGHFPRAIRQRNFDQEDEFSLLIDTTEEEEEPKKEFLFKGDSNPSIILNRNMPPISEEYDDLPDPEELVISPEGIEVDGDNDNDIKETFKIIMQSFVGTEICPRCLSAPKKDMPSPFRRMFLGTPFHLGISLPILLSHLPQGKNWGELPHSGQRLITFTDSRQGTARMAVHLQQGAELNSARSSIYRSILLDNGEVDGGLIEKLELLREIYSINPSPKNRERLENIQNKVNKKKVSASWGKMICRLSSESDVKKWILKYYKNQDEEYFGSEGEEGVAKILMMREFFRRPKWMNSLETMGLVSLRWPSIDNLEGCPEIWKKMGLSEGQWKDFLHVIIDHYIRANSFVDTRGRLLNWLGIPAKPRTVVRWDQVGYRDKARWLQYRGMGRLSRIASLLARALNLDLSVNKDLDIFNEIFQDAWNDLTRGAQAPLRPNTQGEYALAYSNSELVVPDKIWICPLTGRALPTVFKGALKHPITPYLPTKAPVEIGLCDDPVRMPRPETGDRILDRAYIKQWLQEDEQVQALRTIGFWTNLHDRILMGARFFSVAEHSAQQPGWLLQTYERKFKEGRINILSCSTTMELGVDIGGLSAVAMNDAPPHPANYLQRCGRAGRRHESRALAFTMCRNNAHEQMIFSHPEWPFVTPSPIPHVGMDSEPIVQRHVNAYLLGSFLRAAVDDALHLSACAFLLPPEGNGETRLALSDQFVGWLEEAMDADTIVSSLNRITRETILQDVSATSLISTTIERISELAEDWRKEHNGLEEEKRFAEKGTPAFNAAAKRLERFEKEYLLKELATRGFLPAYGFPILLAHFNYLSVREKERLRRHARSLDRDDNRLWLYNLPSRDMGTAIREYAPGADIVLDGRVYKSAGIELSWKIPQTEDEVREPQDLRYAYRCKECGHVEIRRIWKKDRSCIECGSKSLQVHEFLTPTGFSIDFSISPHNDVTHQVFIPPKDPFVVVDENWTWLPDASLGKWRTSRQGNLFQHSAGLYGEGYAICFACGRAVSQTQRNELPEAFRTEHKRLRSSATCVGSFNSWMIKKDLHLGFVQQTDIFQIALRDKGRWLNDRTIATSLAVAMRQALAQILGVEVEELGYTVTPLSLDNQPATVITLYDSCTGGAGFASQAGVFLCTLLEKTKQVLQCKRECEKVCHGCLLGHDTRHDHKYLDRRIALEYFNHLNPLNRLNLIANTRILEHKPDLEFTPLLRALAEQIARPEVENILIQVAGLPEEWDLEEWPLMERLVRWGLSGKRVKLLLADTILRDLKEEQRFQLMRFTSVSNLQLVSVPSIRLNGKYYLLAAIQLRSGDSILWTCEDESPLLPGGKWGKINRKPIYRVFVSHDDWRPPESTLIDFRYLVPRDRENAHNWKIGRNLDGLIFARSIGQKSFGARFLNLLECDAAFLREALLTGKIHGMTYTDRYVNSPLAAALLASLLHALKPRLAEDADIQLILADYIPANHEPTQIFHNWPDTHERTRVMQALLESLDINATITECPKKQMEHARKLSLQLNDGREITILLDQGMGFWLASRGRTSRFDFHASAEEQARKLLNIPIHVAAPSTQVTYVHAWMT